MSGGGTSTTSGGTSVISASCPWLVQAVRTIFDTPNHFPQVSALARNLASFLSLRIWLLGNAVAHVQQAAFDLVGDFGLAIQKVAEQRQVVSERKRHRFGAGASCDGYA